jgi:hypothetical protein
MTLDPTTLVKQQLAAAGIAPTDDEVSAIIAATPDRLTAIEAIWAVPEARYEEPCIVTGSAPFAH